MTFIEDVRIALKWAEAASETHRLRAQRTAISAEDWRYTNGFNAALKYFQTPAIKNALSKSTPERTPR